MKKNFTIVVLVILVFILAVALMFEKKDSSDGIILTTEISTTETTSMVEESTTEAIMEEEFTIATTEKETEIFEDKELFREKIISVSDLPFDVDGVENIEMVKLYTPIEPIGDEDVWETTYVLIECNGNSENVMLKFHSDDGMCVGNIEPKLKESAYNITFVHVDGRYTQEYILEKYEEMIILKHFPNDVSEIKISNKSAFPIFYGEIDDEYIVFNDIILQFK